MALTWNNVQEYTDGGHYLDFISVKTQADNLIPISDEAYMLLGEKDLPLTYLGRYISGNKEIYLMVIQTASPLALASTIFCLRR